ncbi:hypothetical protein QM467_04570 [Rhodoblastus sp. 17X3]|uniref:hypothetical protein n=1 Tax=Rhodoblastus sp. 17X3 TaxID=3047026 RepID=UPI0024B86514|nr:hypothetical protein [Rhodoblastus sp. 17X3]MDI9847333.1 hypothetical protein [Rhodoblastus sp. 17X3]
MAKIRDASTLLGMIDGGDIAADLTTEITDTLAAIEASRAGRKKTSVSGSVTLKIKFKAENGGVTIDADIDSNRPKKVRGSTYLFVDSDGSLSTEHPQQTDMFNGPRDLSRAV